MQLLQKLYRGYFSWIDRNHARNAFHNSEREKANSHQFQLTLE